MTGFSRIRHDYRPGWPFRAPPGRQERPQDERPTSLSRRLRFRRYLVVSTGISTTALGLAVVVSVLAVMHTRAGPAPIAGLAIPVQSFASSVFFETAHSRYEPPPPPPPAPVIVPAPPPPARAPSPPPVLASQTQHTTKGRIANVNLTFYDCASQGFCGAMANGRRVYEGAAACSWNLALGTKFVIIGDPTGRIYSCEDRGLLSNTWVDVFWYDPADGWRWQAAVGRYGVIEIVEVPGK
jgi:hypothetical protein